MADENDQQTLRDLFRVINDMRGEMNARFEHVDARFEHVDARFDAVDARFDAVDARFDAVETKIDTVKDELKGETQAIREVIDTLPSEGDFQELDRKVAVVANDTKATRTDVRNLKAEVSRLRSDVKSAGISVR